MGKGKSKKIPINLSAMGRKSEALSTVTSRIMPFDESPDMEVGRTIDPAFKPSISSFNSSWTDWYIGWLSVGATCNNSKLCAIYWAISQ